MPVARLRIDGAAGLRGPTRQRREQRVGVGQGSELRGKLGVDRRRAHQARRQGQVVFFGELPGKRLLAEQVVGDVVGRAVQDLLAVVAGIEPRAMVHRLAHEVVAADLRLAEEHGIVGHGDVGHAVAVAQEEIRHGRLVAAGQAVAPHPPLLDVRGLHHQRVAHEPTGGEAAGGMRRPGWRVRSAVHPHRPEPFRRLAVDVDGDQPLRPRVTVLPDPEVAGRAHLVRRDISLALVVAQRHPGRVVGQRPQPAGFVQREAAVIGDLVPGAALVGVFVQDARPVAGQIDDRRRRRALAARPGLLTVERCADEGEAGTDNCANVGHG